MRIANSFRIVCTLCLIASPCFAEVDSAESPVDEGAGAVVIDPIDEVEELDAALRDAQALPEFENGETIQGFDSPAEGIEALSLQNGDTISVPEAEELEPGDSIDEDFEVYE